MIPAACFTNLDDYKHEKWPTTFPAVPHRGQRVQAESGKTLKIVNITWVAVAAHGDTSQRTYMRVELHRT